MRLITAIVVCLAQAAPLAATAQDPGAPPAGVAPIAPAPRPPAVAPDKPSRRTYLTLLGGVYQPRGGGDIMPVFDNGLNLAVALGVELSRNVALEGGIGYYASSTGTITETDPVLGTMTAKLDLSVIPITGSVRFLLPAGAVTFSALAGVGIHMAELEGEVNIPGVVVGTASDSANAFGLHLGGGLAVRVSERASLGAEVRHTFLDADLMDDSLDLGGLQFGATLAFRL
jgi:opacity protein-like surface antigen